MFNRRIVQARSLAVVAAAVGGACGLARADEFTFAYSDSITTAAGWLRTSAAPLSNGGFSVTEGLLSITAGPLKGEYDLIANPSAPGTAYSPKGKFIYDSVLFPQAPSHMNVYGLLFAAKGREVNIWGNGAASPYSLWSSKGNNYDYSNDAGSFVLEGGGGAIPTPGTSAVALVAVGFVVCRRRHMAA